MRNCFLKNASIFIGNNLLIIFVVYTNTVTGENCPSYKITPIERNVTSRPNTGKFVFVLLFKN